MDISLRSITLEVFKFATDIFLLAMSNSIEIPNAMAADNEIYSNNSAIYPYDDHYFDYNEGISEGLPENDIATATQKYLPPILIVVGTLGNVVLLFILRREKFRALSVFTYMKAFVVGNTVILYVGTGVQWACFMASWRYIADWTDWGCRLWMFGVNVIVHSSVWFAVGMAADRYIIVWHPQKALEVCSVFIGKIVVIAIMIGLTSISVHAMWTYELLPLGCFLPQDQQDFHSVAWPWISDTFYYFVPLMLIFIFSTLTTIGLCLKRLPQGLRTPSRPDEKEVTVATLTLSIVFFLLASPATIVKIIQTQIPESWLHDQTIMEQFTIMRTLCHMAAAFNNAASIFVLVLVSQSFREEAKRICVDLCYRRCLLPSPEEHKIRHEMATTHVSIEEPCTETTPL